MTSVGPPQLLAAASPMLSAGRRVLKTAELGEVAGVHRASAVRFTPAHPPLDTVRTLGAAFTGSANCADEWTLQFVHIKNFQIIAVITLI